VRKTTSAIECCGGMSRSKKRENSFCVLVHNIKKRYTKTTTATAAIKRIDHLLNFYFSVSKFIIVVIRFAAATTADAIIPPRYALAIRKIRRNELN
jgi:hypothetical protein